MLSETRVRRPSALGWRLPLAGVPVAGAVYVCVPADSLVSLLFYDGFIVLCALLVGFVGFRQAREQRAVWWCLAGALVAYVTGDVIWCRIEQMTGSPPAAVSVADIGYLAYYPLLTVSLLLMLRRRNPGRDIVGLLDALILSIGFGLIVWVVLVIPSTSGTDRSMIGHLIALSYPGMDLALLSVALRLITAHGSRPASFLLLVSGVTAMLAGDIVYGILAQFDAYTAGGWLDVLWLASHASLAAAALHPSAPALPMPAPNRSAPTLTPARIAALGAALLFAPLVAALAPTATQRMAGISAAAALFLLVLARLTEATRALTRTEARFRSLVEHGADPIVVIDRAATIRFASPAWTEMLGEIDGAGTEAGERLTDRLHPDSCATFTLVSQALAAEPIGTTRSVTGRLRHADGSWRLIEARTTNRLADPAVRGLVLNVRDVTDRAHLEGQLRHAALHDPLTLLPNRALLTDRVAHALIRLERQSHGVAVLLVDLDDFKLVNDSLGHTAGDQLLVTVADRLRGCVRPADTVARLGGDEFAVLLPDLLTPDDAHTAAERIRAVLADPIRLDDRHVSAAGSVGIAFATVGQSADALLRNADLAMYAAKRAGKGRCVAYDPELYMRASTRLRVQGELSRALELDQFVLHYQPIVDLRTERPVAAEALLRWRHPSRGLLRPAEFLAIAEQSGLIVPLGRWVLRTACTAAGSWHVGSPAMGAWSLSVNLAARQLAHPHLVDDVAAALADACLRPARLIVEITETSLLQDPDTAVVVLRELRGLGVRVALDDFGTGYSSLSHLQRFPVDIVKIDKSFIDVVAEDPEHTIAAGIIRLAHSLGLETIGEGVEHRDQAASLAALGCDAGQGHYYVKPLPAEVLERQLADASRTTPLGLGA